MSTRRKNARVRWIVWDPQEKLWTRTIVGGVHRVFNQGSLIERGILWPLITADSFLLLGRVFVRRLRLSISGRSYARRGLASRAKVLYLDCGVHKEGKQIRYMHQWFSKRYDLQVLGFEAGSEHVADARSELADLDEVRLDHVALVGPDHVGNEVRLYIQGGAFKGQKNRKGKGDSLFSTRSDEFEVVPASRLSQVLKDGGYPLDEMPVILRMNIEGAEQYVIEDLVREGLHTSIDGYYGMWDDVGKISQEADKHFRKLLRANGITNITFNDRDLPYRLRRLAIRIDIETSIRRGLLRVRCRNQDTST